MPTKNNYTETGQSLIEAFILMKVILSLISTVLFFIYFIYSNHIVDFFSQKSLLCLETLDKRKYDCEKELKNYLDSFLFFHSPTSISLKKLRHKNTVAVTAHIFGKNKLWKNQLKKLR